jgi:hypothetical protein
MITCRLFLVAFSCVALVAASSAADAKADPREKLETAIPEGIRLLEAKEYAKFLKNFVSPDVLKKLTEKQTLEEFAKEFGEEKAARLLKALQTIKDAKPELDADGKKATYKLKERPLIFVKIDKYWYIEGK